MHLCENDEKVEEPNMTIHCENNAADKVSSTSEDSPMPSMNEELLHKKTSSNAPKFNLKSGFASEYFKNSLT